MKHSLQGKYFVLDQVYLNLVDSYIKFNLKELLRNIVQELNAIEKHRRENLPSEVLIGLRGLLVNLLTSLKEEVSLILL